MSTFYIKNINESNRLKKKICENCMEELKGIFSDNQLKRFEDVFYSALNGCILKRKDSANGNV